MSPIFFRSFLYIRHYFRGFRGRRGYGIHSPFAFDFATNVMSRDSSHAFYAYDEIEKLRHQLYNNKNVVNVINGKQTSVAKLARTSAAPVYDAQLIFKIAQLMNSKRILELGTSLGITTAYLAKSSKKAKVISIDHDGRVQNIAKRNHTELGINNIEYIEGTFSEVLDGALSKLGYIDLLYIDGNHTYDGTLEYFNTSLKYIKPSSVIIFHDIHWSKDMYNAWSSVITNDKITQSFETYNLGIIFFDPDLNKEHYYV